MAHNETIDPNILRMVVASDIHLGYRESEPLRAEETFETFEEVLRLASTHKVDMVVLTGNLFHTATPSRRTFSRAVEALSGT